MSLIWIVVIAIIAVFLLIAFWAISKNISDVLADIRHGKGIFLTFNYTPEEWEYYVQTLPFTGKIGKVCFTRNHLYISDGTEEILYEIVGSKHLRNISIDSDFLIFTVRNKELVSDDNGRIKPDSPDNLSEFTILIPNSQRNQTDELINFYQKLISKKHQN